MNNYITGSNQHIINIITRPHYWNTCIYVYYTQAIIHVCTVKISS